MKSTHRYISIILALVMTIIVFSNVFASYQAESAPIYKHMSTTNSSEWSFETSGAAESITATAEGWTMQAGGDIASTHYARAKYKLPESSGAVFTYFYTKAVIVLPDDFYTRQNSGFRILNTDNYQTTLNGVPVGASGADELRVSVYMNSDHTLRVLVDHENGTKIELYAAPAILPTGEHTFEFSGDVEKSAPWYLKIDGVTAASGTQRLSTDEMADSERVITRFVAGIDGAADQDQNAVNVMVKSLEIANYDLSIAATTPTPIPPTATPSATPAVTETPAPTTTPNAPSVVNIRIANGKNDVEENSKGKIINDTDLELVYDTSLQTVGLRFTGVDIPNGAAITNAYIQFKVDEISTKVISLKIQGEASANAPAFASTTRNVSSRLRTTNTVTWLPPSWSKVGLMGTNQATPDLSSVIQEIVSQAGWVSGNPVVIIITGSKLGKRVAESFEGDAAGAPLLHIEYTTPAAP